MDQQDKGVKLQTTVAAGSRLMLPLPVEVWRKVASWLDARDVASLASVNRDLASFLSDDQLWQALYCSHFGSRIARWAATEHIGVPFWRQRFRDAALAASHWEDGRCKECELEWPPAPADVASAAAPPRPPPAQFGGDAAIATAPGTGCQQQQEHQGQSGESSEPSSPPSEASGWVVTCAMLDGHLLVTGSISEGRRQAQRDTWLHVWHLPSGACMCSMPGPDSQWWVTGVDIEGDYIMAAEPGGRAVAWRLPASCRMADAAAGDVPPQPQPTTAGGGVGGVSDGEANRDGAAIVKESSPSNTDRHVSAGSAGNTEQQQQHGRRHMPPTLSESSILFSECLTPGEGLIITDVYIMSHVTSPTLLSPPDPPLFCVSCSSGRPPLFNDGARRLQLLVDVCGKVLRTWELDCGSSPDKDSGMVGRLIALPDTPSNDEEEPDVGHVQSYLHGPHAGVGGQATPHGPVAPQSTVYTARELATVLKIEVFNIVTGVVLAVLPLSPPHGFDLHSLGMLRMCRDIFVSAEREGSCRVAAVLKLVGDIGEEVEWVTVYDMPGRGGKGRGQERQQAGEGEEGGTQDNRRHENRQAGELEAGGGRGSEDHHHHHQRQQQEQEQAGASSSCPSSPQPPPFFTCSSVTIMTNTVRYAGGQLVYVPSGEAVTCVAQCCARRRLYALSWNATSPPYCMRVLDLCPPLGGSTRAAAAPAGPSSSSTAPPQLAIGAVLGQLPCEWPGQLPAPSEAAAPAAAASAAAGRSNAEQGTGSGGGDGDGGGVGESSGTAGGVSGRGVGESSGAACGRGAPVVGDDAAVSEWLGEEADVLCFEGVTPSPRHPRHLRQAGGAAAPGLAASAAAAAVQPAGRAVAAGGGDGGGEVRVVLAARSGRVAVWSPPGSGWRELPISPLTTRYRGLSLGEGQAALEAAGGADMAVLAARVLGDRYGVCSWRYLLVVGCGTVRVMDFLYPSSTST